MIYRTINSNVKFFEIRFYCKVCHFRITYCKDMQTPSKRLDLMSFLSRRNNQDINLNSLENTSYLIRNKILHCSITQTEFKMRTIHMYSTHTHTHTHIVSYQTDEAESTYQSHCYKTEEQIIPQLHDSSSQTPVSWPPPL